MSARQSMAGAARAAACSTGRHSGRGALRRGFSLVELIVALTVFAVGVLGLAAAAAFAQRSFTAADAVERSTRAAAAVLDSLLLEPDIADGERAASGTITRWTVATDSATRVIIAEVEVHHGSRTHRLEFRAAGPAP